MKKAATAIATLLTMIIVFCACSMNGNLKNGTYISIEASVYVGNIGVTLADEDEFMLFAESFSYCPMGKYTVEDDTLTLISAQDEVYVFTIKNGKLIFESGKWLEQMIEKGTTFQLSRE